MPTIRVDDDVFEGLKTIAEPFTDTPNSVIRRLLEDYGVQLSKPIPENSTIANLEIDQINKSSRPSTSLTPQPVYEKYLHYVLANNFNGSASKIDATKAVIQLMKKSGYITTADLQHVSSGETKAENTIAWSRNALKDSGVISKNSPRGIWELTAIGKELAAKIVLPNLNN